MSVNGLVDWLGIGQAGDRKLAYIVQRSGALPELG